MYTDEEDREFFEGLSDEELAEYRTRNPKSHSDEKEN